MMLLPNKLRESCEEQNNRKSYQNLFITELISLSGKLRKVNLKLVVL